MDEKDGAVLTRHWLDKSKDALESARVLMDHAQYAACVNRLYYAAFYSFNAVLATDNRAYGKHSAVRSSIHRDYVKPGLLSSEVGLIYNRLFEWRQKADYEVMMRVDQAMAADLFSQTERLLNEMDRCLADA